MFSLRGLWQTVRCLALALLLVGGFARAAHAEAFVAPTLGNLIKTLIRYGALNIRDDKVVDEYTIVNECKIYQHFVPNDFRWHEVQKAVRESIRQNVAVFPTGYRYDAAMQLDRYDFDKKIFRFALRQGQKTVNSFVLSALGDGKCGNKKPVILEETYKFVLDRSVQFPGIPLTPEEAKGLLKRMDEAGNKSRVVYARFNLNVTYIGSLQPPRDTGGVGRTTYRQNQVDPAIRIDSRLDSIDIFEDEERTKLLIKFKP